MTAPSSAAVTVRLAERQPKSRKVSSDCRSRVAVTSRQGDNPNMTALMPMLEKYHVTAALFGHDHNYQHYLKNGIHYLVAGGGGAPLYDVDKPPQDITIKVAETENFIRVRVNGKTAHADAIGPDGATIDSMNWERSSH